MFFSIAESSSSAAANFSFAIRDASALPSRARTNSARSSGNRARRELIAVVCASKSAGGGSIAWSSDNFFNNIWSAASLTRMRASTAFTSRSHTSACPNKPQMLFLRFRQARENAEILERGRVAGHFRSACDFLEQTSHDFSAARFRQRLGEADLIRFRDRADVHADVFAQFQLQ